jgi:C4-dicarboxylate transporter DctQ subunit
VFEVYSDMKTLGKLFDDLARGLAVGLGGGIFVLVAVSVLMREVFHTGWPFLTELLPYLNIYAVMLLLGPLLKTDRHINISALVSRLSAHNQWLLNVIASFSALLFAVFLTYSSVVFVLTSRALTETCSTMPNVPRYLFKLAFPIGWLTLSYYYIVRLIRFFHS